MLVSYRWSHQQHQLHAQDGRMAFALDHNDDGGKDSHTARQDEFDAAWPRQGGGHGGCSG